MIWCCQSRNTFLAFLQRSRCRNHWLDRLSTLAGGLPNIACVINPRLIEALPHAGLMRIYPSWFGLDFFLASDAIAHDARQVWDTRLDGRDALVFQSQCFCIPHLFRPTFSFVPFQSLALAAPSDTISNPQDNKPDECRRSGCRQCDREWPVFRIEQVAGPAPARRQSRQETRRGFCPCVQSTESQSWLGPPPGLSPRHIGPIQTDPLPATCADHTDRGPRVTIGGRAHVIRPGDSALDDRRAAAIFSSAPQNSLDRFSGAIAAATIASRGVAVPRACCARLRH